MESICIYLRKSRTDEEAERHGQGETLSRHREILLKFAKEKGLNIVTIREEVVSGESLVHRPEMLDLLKDLDEDKYDGVLCMDLDRLGRGNMQEQGLILDTFKRSKTKIITPRKIYDLENEFDEEYSEFEAFMARKELKIINRRLQRGRIKSVEDGNYIATIPPYGYDILQDNNNRTLTPNPEQTPIVKLIFQLYVNEEIGCSKIANRLNQLGYKTYTGRDWSNYSVLNIIKNEVYTGKIQWGKTKAVKSKKNLQKREVQKRPKNEWIDVDGKHEEIISIETFNKAQEILKTRSHVPYNTKIVNPLAGLITCGSCRASMVMRSYSKSSSHIICYKKCGNKSAKFDLIEDSIIYALKNWMSNYSFDWEKYKTPTDKPENMEKHLLYKMSLKKLKGELYKLDVQKNNLHDLLEQGVYDENIFFERSQNLKSRIKETQSNIEIIQSDLNNLQLKNSFKASTSILELKNILDIYPKATTPKEKNILLKTILHSVEYKKNKNQYNDSFTLILYPKIPK